MEEQDKQSGTHTVDTHVEKAHTGITQDAYVGIGEAHQGQGQAQSGAVSATQALGGFPRVSSAITTPSAQVTASQATDNDTKEPIK